MHDVYALYAQLFTGSLNHPTHKVHKDNILSTLRSVLTSVRTYMVTEPKDLHAVWGMLRNEPPAFDFLMDLNTQLLAALHCSPMPFERLVECLAAAMGVHKPANGRSNHTALDQDMMNRLPDQKAAKDVLSANSWFVTLMLLGFRADLVEVKP